VDSHCHLQDAAFDADRDEVVARATKAGIERLLVPGWHVASSRAAVRLAERYPDLIDAAVGVHPHHAADAGDEDWAELERLARHERVVAIGEIGLDHFRNLSPPREQATAFARQLALAEERDLPVLVHDRDAHDDVRAALLAWSGLSGGTARGVLHAFSGDADMARELSGAGFLVSFALPVAFRSAIGPRAAAAAVAAGRFLVETDAPWLAPGGSGARNEPTTVLRVAAELARLRATSPQAIAQEVRTAYRALAHH
jgi:TatD DNase family protein